jgi:hypothetical protein
MRYAQINSKYVCGIDLHAREMYACVMNEKGEIFFHRNMVHVFVLLAGRCLSGREYSLLSGPCLLYENHS